MPRFFNMGNTCPLKAHSGSQHKMTIPRNLTELLEDLDEIDPENLDKTIEEHTWCKQFREYLKSRDLSEDEITLKFLVLTQALVNLDQKLKDSKLSRPKRTGMRQEQEAIFKKAVTKFFAEESEEQVALSNQTLYNALAGADLSAKSVTDQQLEYLRKAREDSSVWMEGLEPTFLRFLKQASPSVLACLLSIL